MIRHLDHIKQLEGLGFRYIYDAARVSGNIPKTSGVYCFVKQNLFSKKSQVVYVGKSINLSVRLKPWHRVESIFNDKECWLFCYFLKTENQDAIEIELIKRFTPVFNIQHNPNIQRKIIYQNGKTLY